MFDFSFSELVVIMVVALIVIGPERLPKVARTMGHLWGRAQRYINGVRADIERDMHMDELKQLKQKVEQEAASAMQAASQTGLELEKHMKSLHDPEPAPAEQPKPRSIPAADTAPKEPTAVPEQKQFPID
ncbi:MAG: Sec-independent protein translocase protein TatB [Gallionella sp.]